MSQSQQKKECSFLVQAAQKIRFWSSLPVPNVLRLFCLHVEDPSGKIVAIGLERGLLGFCGTVVPTPLKNVFWELYSFKN